MAKTNIWIDGSQAGATLKDLKKEVALLNREIQNLPRNSDAYNKKVKELAQANTALKQHRAEISGVAQSFKGLPDIAKQVGSGITSALGPIGLIAGAVTGVVAGISGWISTNRELSKSMSTLKALTQASAEDMKFYRQESIEMSKEYGVAVTDVVEAIKLIGGNRAELLNNKEAMMGVTREVIALSQAAEIDLASAANAVTGSMNQFNMASSEGSRIINALAAGSNIGAAEIKDLNDTIEKSGSVMAGYNVSLEEGVALSEILAERNLKGAEAGTQLRNVLLTMQSIEALPEKALSALKQYGVDIEKVANDQLPFNERLKEMQKISGDATAMVKVFGKENIVAGKAVLENVKKFEDFTEAVTGTNAAYQMQETIMDNLDGDLLAMSSAWDGLMLSMDGSENIFRPIIQGFTSAINWVSDTITAFKNFDLTHIGDQFTKVVLSIPVLGDALDQMSGGLISFGVRFNETVREMTDQVMSSAKSQGDAVSVLIQSINENNKALKDKNITEEEAKDLMNENEKMINAVKDAYPELTENMDLNAMSTRELAALNRDINKTIIDRALANAQAAQTEKMLGDMIQNTIKITEIQNKIKAGDLNFFQKASAGNELMDLMKERKEIEQSLKTLPEAMKRVQAATANIDLGFGKKFEIETQTVKDAQKELTRLTAQYESATSDTDKKILEGKIRAQKTLISSFSKSLKDQQDAAVGAMVQTTEQATNNMNEKVANVSKEAAKQIQKLRDELDKLRSSYAKMQADFDYEQRLDQYEEGLDKELFALEHSINEKYAKEISALEELSAKKGEIGLKSQEQLDSMLILKTDEFEYKKAQLQEKYRKEKSVKDAEEFQRASQQYLAQQASLEQSIVDLRIAQAAFGVQAASKASRSEQAKAEREYVAAIQSQLEHRKKLELESIMDRYSEGIINHEDYLKQKELLDLEYTQKSEEISKKSADNINRSSMDKMSEIGGYIQTAINVFSEMADAQYQKRMAVLDKEQDKELQRLEKMYQNKEISEEEYLFAKAEAERKYEEEKKIAANANAKKQKDAAIAQAIIGAALAVVQAFAQLGPIGGAIAALTVGVATMAQISKMNAAEVEQYYEGGFHNVIGSKDGKNYRARYIGRHPGGMLPSSPSLVLASEKGKEYYVPNHLLSEPRVANYVGMIEAIRTNQMADGGYYNGSAPDGSSSSYFLEMIAKNTKMLEILSVQLNNLTIKVGDQQIDDIATRSDELNKVRA